jgi:hypothetical protein
MKNGFIFFGLLAISTSGVAGKFKHQPISYEAKSYVKQSLKSDELVKQCNEYEYKIFATGVTTKKIGSEITEIVQWAVSDNIGTKMDLHIYGFKTTNGKVTSELALVHESTDWQYYLEECKAHNKPIKRD